ncbi:MAG TPA: hypothetical protein H9986_07965, partial [Candidatus Prevotella stercoripullorum]|nr:hypothetical protein [Candidatus Prevotella stercoripullorum]
SGAAIGRWHGTARSAPKRPVAGASAKGRRLQCKRPPFGVQFTAFQKAKDGLWESAEHTLINIDIIFT